MSGARPSLTFGLAGFAGQPRYGGGAFLADVKDAIVAYLKKNKLEKPIVFGHSLGGHMALWMASGTPGLTGPLVIVDSLPHLGAMMIGSQTKEQYGAYIKSSKMLESMVGARGLPEVREWSMTSDPLAVGNAMFDLYTTDLREAIANIDLPVLVLSTWIAYKDYTTREKSVATVEEQFAKLPQQTIRVSDTAKHFLMLDEPKWFFAELDTFLKQ